MPEKSITISAPADKVFSYLADLPRHSEWAQHRLKIEQTSSGPIGQGSTFKCVGHQMGRDNEDMVTITEYVPNQRLVYESNGNAGLMRHTFELAPVEGGLQVTKRFEAVQAKVPFSLLLPIVNMFVMPGALSGDLRRIREKLEAS